MNNLMDIDIFSDLDLKWYPHPLTGNVTPLINIDSIRQSILNLFLLNPYDIPFNPNAHANLRKYLFDPIINITAISIRKRLEWLIKTYEKRVELFSIEVLPIESENGFEITIQYKIIAFNYEDTIVKFFQRTK